MYAQEDEGSEDDDDDWERQKAKAEKQRRAEEKAAQKQQQQQQQLNHQQQLILRGVVGRMSGGVKARGLVVAICSRWKSRCAAYPCRMRRLAVSFTLCLL